MDDNFPSHLKGVSAMETAFWKLEKNGFNVEAERFRYVADASLEEHNCRMAISENLCGILKAESADFVECFSARAWNDDSRPGELIYPELPSHYGWKNWSLTRDKINDMTLLKHVDPRPGITRCMFYIGTAFTYFPYHAEDDDLALVQYLGEGASRV